MSRQSGLRSPAPSPVQLIQDIMNFYLSQHPADMNLGPVEPLSSQCLGAIYTLNPGSKTIKTNGTANWIFGTASMPTPKPFMIGFAELATQSSQSSHTISLSTRLKIIAGCVGGGVGFLVLLVIVKCFKNSGGNARARYRERSPRRQ
ncbi:hypothetical protein B0H19DRAFT_1069565 [Mycena capillaripes]|nr:hypothetical protein B0H19DRAFT_1069565 [Mycena capillaripes]